MEQPNGLILIDIRAAARQAKVSIYTIRRWIKRGLLPATRPGGYRYLIHPDDLSRPFEPVNHAAQRTGSSD